MYRNAVFFLLAATLLAQTPARIPPDLQFEVASLKPAPDENQAAEFVQRRAASGMWP